MTRNILAIGAALFALGAMGSYQHATLDTNGHVRVSSLPVDGSPFASRQYT